MKYLILIGDGMADFPLPELGGKTPLEHAKTPNMDMAARMGSIGRVATIPKGLPPGSDVANMSLMGYDPALYYSGRAPIEAASLGVKLEPDDTAFRCNLVTLDQGLMSDYSAGHIETDDAREILAELSMNLGNEAVRFYPGISYRHLVVIQGMSGEIVCTPPHDISGKDFGPYLPKGPGSDIILLLMERAHSVLVSLQVNKKRVKEGKMPATDIWLWGQGQAVALPLLRDRYGIGGGVISAVDLVRGLGILAGLEAPRVPGATGYLGTNYAGKIEAAKAILEKEDFAYLHVEAPDETSHEGSIDKKIQAIEEFDTKIVGEMLEYQQKRGDLRILVAPDHATPVSMKTHHEMPVPFAVCGPGIARDSAAEYGEKAAGTGKILTGVELFDKFIKGNF